MNERITLLAKQATRPRGPNKPAEFDKEYFARLIVQECAAQCNITKENMRDQDPFWEDVANQCREDIKELFGVD